MKLTEIKEKIKNKKLNEVTINYKNYVPLYMKFMYIQGDGEKLNGIIDNIIVLNDDMFERDYLREEIELLVAKIILYTDIEIDIDFTMEDYDFIMIYLPSMLNHVDDWKKFISLYNKIIDQKIKNLNSVEKVLNKMIKQLPSEDALKSTLVELTKTLKEKEES